MWLWGVDFGDHDGRNYTQKYTNKAIFTINFGSGKHRFNARDNPMTALLAQQWYTLATGWGGRPAWWLHQMSLGASIGDTHFRTVNNGVASQPYRDTMDYYPTGDYLFRNPIWVNLLGDPTARPFPLAAPINLSVAHNNGQVTLSWQASPDPDVSGYKVYRAPEGTRDFRPISDGIIESTSFVDTAPMDGAQYMVRAYGLKQVHAGSFYRFSRGIFSAATPPSETDIVLVFELSTQQGQPVPLPAEFSYALAASPIYALLREPAQGRLSYVDGGWLYTPSPGFQGTVTLPFSVSDALQTEKGKITITVR